MPVPKMVVPKCLKLIWNHSGIISGTYFSLSQGVYYLYRGLRRAPKLNFGLILDFSIIFLIFFRPGLFLVTQTDIDTTLAYPFHQKHICAYLRYWDENWFLWGAKRTRKWISFSKLIQSLYKSLISTIEKIIIIIIMNIMSIIIIESWFFLLREFFLEIEGRGAGGILLSDLHDNNCLICIQIVFYSIWGENRKQFHLCVYIKYF